MQDGPHRPEDQGRHRQGADGFPVLCGPATQGLHAYSPTATPIQAGNHQPQPPGHDRATQSTQWRGRCRGQGRPHRAGISRARDAQPEAHLQGGCATGPLPTHCTHPASIHRTRARATAKPAASAPRSGPWSDWPRLRPRMPCPHRDRGQHLVADGQVKAGGFPQGQKHPFRPGSRPCPLASGLTQRGRPTDGGRRPAGGDAARGARLSPGGVAGEGRTDSGGGRQRAGGRPGGIVGSGPALHAVVA